MDSKVQQAYESLVPADQMVIDAMIATLIKKDRQNRECVAEVHGLLDAVKAKKAEVEQTIASRKGRRRKKNRKEGVK